MWRDSRKMLRQATIMADRLAAKRYARPIVFLCDQSSELTAILMRIGRHFASRGHEIAIVDEASNVGSQIEEFSGTIDCSRLRLMLIPNLHELDRRILAKLLDELHLVARDGFPVGCIATGSPETPKLVGELRSFAERLFEFRRASIRKTDSEAGGGRLVSLSQIDCRRPEADNEDLQFHRTVHTVVGQQR